MRQNRVTPLGEIVALPGRGTIMGNRGVLHSDDGAIVRPWQVRRWIACRLEFRGRRRKIMQPRSWTELFFLDEATALSAGHRPCAECRNADYKRFRSLWEMQFGAPAGADAMDVQLHADRIANRGKRTYRDAIENLPDGTYLRVDGAPWLLWENALHRWSDGAYIERIPRPRSGDVEILTPRSIVAILAAGYIPAVHPSATG